MRRHLLWWGIGTLLAAIALGAYLTIDGGADDPSTLDAWWHDAMVDARPDALVAFSHVMNRIGGGWIAVFAVPGIVAVALLIARRWRSAIFALAAFITSAALVQLLKQLFGRARPEDMLVISDYGSYPSGHTANAATIAIVLWVLFPRVWMAVLGAAWVLAMALSRTVLSVHWLTDTVGGALVGASAALLVAALLLPWVRGDAPVAVTAAIAGGTDRVDPAVTTAGRELAEESAVPQIRPYRPEDRDGLFDVCVRTADAGADATGMFTDDDLWGLLFAVPYAERDPGLCWVVEAEDGRVIGYIVSTDDTDAFEQWFRDEWWPRYTDRFPKPADPQTAEERMLAYAYGRGPGREPNAAEYPAHLHIDLLPETQGKGLGRRLLETLFAELRRRGVPGLHLGMNPANTGAAAFYDRVGMHRLPSPEGSWVYGVRFDG
ncbi:GNAT family N-acetyltransferase [Microbacterium sp. CIAB417]|uniref:GNAT family N-acetyltransferase n=1 Tax=Microbacterium sp. CIAB417 TaxID=2860287 RepID=UPI0027E21884|nr:GNAT family N-acetyltransferase [Microbacterium sp. CIAB417]